MQNVGFLMTQLILNNFSKVDINLKCIYFLKVQESLLHDNNLYRGNNCFITENKILEITV